MAKIQRLDAHLMNMIAAGEVVERPMGVVKELIENAIDAHAHNIEIHIKEGGLSEIMIIDDGEGMSAADASMAFERHATSKIHEMNDLWKINTMGFRGEALPSIASVANVHLKTNDGVEASEVEIQYGTLTKAGFVGTPKGTQIIVKNLFQKTPARLKHLKTPQYEFSLISDVVQKFALAHSEIAFTLTHDGRSVFNSKGKGNLLEVIMEIYGREVAKAAIPIRASDTDYVLKGYAIQPSQNRASKYYMLCYINDRMIRSYRLQKAIIDAYAPYLPKDRFPIVVLDIKMDPKLVDVNVHPSKWEVRLSKEKQLEKLIKDSIGDVLTNKLSVSKVERMDQSKQEVVEPVRFDFSYTPNKQAGVYQENSEVNKITQEIREEFASYQSKSEKKTDTPMRDEQKSMQEEIVQKSVEEYNEEIKLITKEPQSTQEKTDEEVFISSMSVNPSFPYMEVIGQLKGCYILAQGENGLYIIDQHAAQERYHYEVIQEMVLQGVKDSQPLLVPLTIESSMGAVAQIDDINALLNQVGIVLEAFGNHTFIIRELPIWMNDIEEEKFIQDMIDFYLKNNEISLEMLRKHTIATMACHSSIRFNRNLSMEEMKQVVEDLKKCKQPFHCPHGRPTFIEMTVKELEKEFYRVK
ncbi:MAG: DNA mismatch repair endonuclease MutL [Erysipelotrichia bacterium]|nr:DNA mismatch repair endonuclease MutL [Erysipelotrichia bacterium]NCC54754.1 DNA mismatch repair endonuclease MutL [Erysipelotrichia bacterium]